MEPSIWVLVPITLFLVMGMSRALRGPLGKALADRIAGRSGGAAEVHQELEDLRQRVAELEERQDFTERMLAQARERPPLEAGG